jgi:polysaccharide export outer membrane protein
MFARHTPIVALALLSACATLPSGGPTSRQILAPTAATLGAPLQLVDISRIPLPPTSAMPPHVEPAWPITDSAAAIGTIRTGDSLGITIFEIGIALFGSTSAAPNGTGQAPPPTATGQTLPPLLVGADGSVSIPFVGSIAVAGRLPGQVEAEIQSRLRGRSQSARVVVTVQRGPGNSIVISGDVKQPGRQPVTFAGEHLLDAIAQAGGPTSRSADTLVRLVRDGVVAERRLDQLSVGSPADVRLAPGDRIELIKRARTFTALGAARTVAEIAFDSDRLTLAEAIARAGGPLDDRADARGVFVFRFEKDANGVEIPTIYQLDLLNPQSYFAAQRFMMREKDVLFTANARSNSLQKFLGLLNLLVAPAFNAAVLVR